jgi:hypothetical protein
MHMRRTVKPLAALSGALLIISLASAVPGGAQEKDKKAPLYLGVAEVGDINVVDTATKGFVTVLKATPTAQKETDLLVQAHLNARNDTDAPVTITYRVVADGTHVDPLTFSTTVAPGAWDLSTVQFLCNAVPAGQHTIEVQAEVAGASAGSGPGVTFAARSMLVVQFGPIVNPPA